MVAHDDTIYFGSGDRTVTASSYSMSVVPSYFASVVPWYLVSGVSSYLGSGDGTVSWNYHAPNGLICSFSSSSSSSSCAGVGTDERRQDKVAVSDRAAPHVYAPRFLTGNAKL